jgi:hypothetical protein
LQTVGKIYKRFVGDYGSFLKFANDSRCMALAIAKHGYCRMVVVA